MGIHFRIVMLAHHRRLEGKPPYSGFADKRIQKEA